MSISTSLSTSSCLTSSFVRLSRDLPSSSTDWRSKYQLGRFPGRAIVCCSNSNGKNSVGSQGDSSEISESKERTTPIKSSRRELVLKSSSAALFVAFLNVSGTRPDYLGVQKNPPSLALCPPTPTCISTSEELNDRAHYVPPWYEGIFFNFNPTGMSRQKRFKENTGRRQKLHSDDQNHLIKQRSYNPPDGRGRKNPASKEKAMAELIEVVQKTKPENYTPRIVNATEDYLYVEYESPLPLLKLVDDVEFWFPPGNRSIVEYRSASRVGQSDFDANRKRIRALRQALEKKGWESVGY